MNRVLAAFVLLTAPAAFAQAPAPQAQVIAEGLDLHCADWLKAGAPDQLAPPSTATLAGWTATRSAAPAVGPILVKGGAWGQASIVRVNQTAGHRCSIAIQLSASGWNTDTAYAAVTDWAHRKLPGAAVDKTRGAGPRGTRESVWRKEALTLTLQEAPDPGAQPNVFITVQRAREI